MVYDRDRGPPSCHSFHVEMKNFMRTRIALSSLLALVLTGAQIPAQAPQSSDQVKVAAAGKIEAAMPLAFSVRGLTNDNKGMVDRSLTSMQIQVYVCGGCKHEQATAGKCAPCNLDMKSTMEPVFLEAASSVEEETIRVTTSAARTLRYSDLESALLKNSVQIDVAKFPLQGQARLVLLGGTLENSQLIEKSLLAAKLFDTVKADYDAASGEIHVSVKAGATPPMRAKVVSTIDGLGTKAKLSDVIWGPQPIPSKV